MTSRFSACIFDMDGVILDSETLWSMATQAFFERRGIVYHDEYKTQMMGRKTEEETVFYKKMFGFPEPVAQLSEERIAILEDIYRTTSLDSLAGFSEFFEEVKGCGWKIGLASGSPLRIIEQVLGTLGIREHFLAVVSGDEVSSGKPAPEIYLKAAERLLVPPETCIAVEDSLNGVKAAKAAGMFCIAVPDLRWSKREDFVGLADAVVGRLDEFRFEASPLM